MVRVRVRVRVKGRVKVRARVRVRVSERAGVLGVARHEAARKGRAVRLAR